MFDRAHWTPSLAPTLLGLGLGLTLLVGCDGASVAGPDASSELDAQVAPDEGPARLFCAEPSFDFGPIWEGTVVEHTFALEVRGRGELSLLAVRGSCGCTVGQLSRADGEPYVFGAPLTPGERLGLEVRFTSQGRQGAQERPVTLYGNLPGDGRFQVQLTGDVGPYLVPETEALSLGELLPGGEALGSVRVTTVDGEPARLAVQTLPPLPPDLHAEIVTSEGSRTGPAAEWVLAVRALPSGRKGAFDYPIRIDTLDEEGSATDVGSTVFVAWSRVQPVEARPRVFPFSVLRRGESAEARVELVAHAPGLDLGALDLDGARVELGGEAAAHADAFSIRSWSEGGRQGLVLVAPALPSGPERRIRGRVLVPVDHAEQLELEVGIDVPFDGRP